MVEDEDWTAPVRLARQRPTRVRAGRAALIVEGGPARELGLGEAVVVVWDRVAYGWLEALEIFLQRLRNWMQGSIGGL